MRIELVNLEHPTNYSTNVKKEDGRMNESASNGKALEKIYTVRKVAETLEVRETLVKRELRKGTMKGFKVGKSWRVTESAIAEYCLVKISNGKGKHRVSESTKAKIRLHTSVRHMENLTNSMEQLETRINTIKGQLPDKDSYAKLLVVSKMRSIIEKKVKTKKALATKEELLNKLAEAAYPGLAKGIDLPVDEIEAFLLQIGQGGNKKEVEPRLPQEVRIQEAQTAG